MKTTRFHLISRRFEASDSSAKRRFSFRSSSRSRRSSSSAFDFDFFSSSACLPKPSWHVRPSKNHGKNADFHRFPHKNRAKP